MREQLEAWVDAHKHEIIAETQAILRIPSVEEEPGEPGAPFGRPVGAALAHTLALCERLGMKTENFDGYIGHAEFGEGEEIVAMLGHLDVVPPGSGWTKEPWGATIEDGWLFARGASDDKGPTYAALFGAKAVLDATQAAGTPLSRRIRLIFGCNEESGFKCVEHYFGAAGQPKPALAFTPDASFPLVYAEKGAFSAEATRRVEDDGDVRVASFRSGLRANMVPDEAEAVLAGDPGILNVVRAVMTGEKGVTIEGAGDTLRLYARGKAAHGSTPQEGENAAVKLLRALITQPDFGAGDRQWMDDLIRRAAPTGAGVGIAGKDEITGPLTCNLGIVTKEEDGEVKATFNVRYPATWDPQETVGKFQSSLDSGGWQVAVEGHMEPLYVPQDQEPVKTLLRVYREHTGDESAPKTMGGRTYATAVAPVGVAFGAGMTGDPDVAHQADERFAVERLLLCAKIYGHALYELAK